MLFFLNLSVDHLDWHGSKLNYLNSKLKIFNLQTAKHYAVVNKNLKRIFNKKKFLSRLIVNKKNDYLKLKHKIKMAI